MKDGEDLARRLDELTAQIAEIRRLLGMDQGATKKNPKKPLPPAVKKARQDAAARRARAGKPVGKGKGAVSSKRMQERLRKEPST